MRFSASPSPALPPGFQTLSSICLCAVTLKDHVLLQGPLNTMGRLDLSAFQEQP